jgi:hypothetical protein
MGSLCEGEIAEGEQGSSSLLALGAQHPIVRTAFDEALAAPSSITLLSRVTAEHAAARLVDAALSGAKVMKLVQSPDGVRLVFSKETTAKLNVGDWHIPVDRTSGLPRAEARDAMQRIREPAKFVPAASHIGAVARGIVAAAHVISSMDTMVQLANISHQLASLLDFVDADRRGHVRGVYLTLQRALADTDQDRQQRTLEMCAAQLESLQARFAETARARLSTIKDPLQITSLKAIFSLQSTAERKLTEELGAVFGDLRLMEFCALLTTEVHKELGNDEGLYVQSRAFRDVYKPILAALEVKARYLSLPLSSEVANRARLLKEHADISLGHSGAIDVK